MPLTDALVYLTLLLAGVWSFTSGRLTVAGSLTGAIFGFVIYSGAGLPGFVMLTLFFVSGSAATKWKKDRKALMNATDTRKGRRTAAQVVANSGVATLLAAYSFCQPQYLPILQFAIAGSFAAATADTLSSELGTIYGRHFYNVITLNKDQAGLDGVVSLEGTLIGIAGACMMAFIYALFASWTIEIFYIIGAGFIGNTVDSILGATLERRQLMGNNAVNFLNTAAGAAVCWILLVYFN